MMSTTPPAISPPAISPLGEAMVSARIAAYFLNLPMYYLLSAKQRHKLRLPYYRLGGLVRFRMSELEAWQRQWAAQEGR